MPTPGVHRIIEHHAATRGDEAALIGADRTLSYRELNQRANALARRLLACGFRRGSRAIVRMARSPELAVVLLAILKAGGAYTWLGRDSDDAWPDGVSIVQREAGDECGHLALDLRQALLAPSSPGPNLPILTRASDVACVLPARHGDPAVLVPHSTIASLRTCPMPDVARWSHEPAALDLWVPLMAGATVWLAASAAAGTAAA